jgi:glyoxylase-like metal-dependent hydrolase (beta-lactamase superfamily II)
MKLLLPGIWQWSWFSEEKQIDFNGLIMAVGEHRIVVDPPPMTAEDLLQARRGSPVDYIVLTNRDHEREAATYQKEFGCRIMVPSADAPQMAIKADRTFEDGDLLPGGVWVIHLHDQKSPGESALFIQQSHGIMIVGDALIGKPPGSLRMLPAEKYTDATKAREGLRRLLKYNFDALLCGDGAAVMTGAKQEVERAITT